MLDVLSMIGCLMRSGSGTLSGYVGVTSWKLEASLQEDCKMLMAGGKEVLWRVTVKISGKEIFKSNTAEFD